MQGKVKSEPAVAANLLADPDLFGRIAAEEEQKGIASYFQETDAFNNVYRGEKYLVLGRKGSGKTALFYYLQKRLEMDGAKVATMTLNDYPQARFADLRATAVDSTEAHVQTWKFALLLTVMGLYLKVVDKVKPGDKVKPDPNIGAYRKFYNQNSLSPITSSLWTNISDFIKSVESFNFTAFTFGGGFTRNLKQVARNEFAMYANQINSRLANLLKESFADHLPNGGLTILIDRLDEQWRNEPQSNALLIGLLKACREINRELTGCKVIVFLRTDIFERLMFQNRAHLTEFIQYLRWSTEDLEMVIARRIAAKVGAEATPDRTTFVREMWSLVFADDEGSTLYYARKSKGQKLSKFFETNSFLRPRDYIQLAKCLQDKAKELKQARIVPKVGATRLDRMAESEYSSRVYLEFQDEVMDVLPDLADIREAISQKLKYYRFSLDEFRNCLDMEKDPAATLRIFFEYSIVGIDNVGGTQQSRGPGGRGYEYRYQSDLVKFDGTETFKFHPSVRSHLQLVARSTKAISSGIQRHTATVERIQKVTQQRRKRSSQDVQTPSLWDDE